MAFIMFLLLLTALGISSASSRSKDRRFEEAQKVRSAERRNRYSMWKHKVVDVDLEKKIQDAAFSMEKWAVDEIEEINRQYGLELSVFSEKAVYAMLAKRGKIHHRIAETGFPAVGAAYSTSARIKRDAQMKYLHMIDEELIKSGVAERMVFRPELRHDTVPMDQHKYSLGRFLWEPIKDTVL